MSSTLTVSTDFLLFQNLACSRVCFPCLGQLKMWGLASGSYLHSKKVTQNDYFISILSSFLLRFLIHPDRLATSRHFDYAELSLPALQLKVKTFLREPWSHSLVVVPNDVGWNKQLHSMCYTQARQTGSLSMSLYSSLFFIWFSSMHSHRHLRNKQSCQQN